MIAQELFAQLQAQMPSLSWVTRWELNMDFYGGPWQFTMNYFRVKGVMIDGPQEQFLVDAVERFSRAAHDVRYLSGGGRVIHGQHEWTGERIYRYYPDQEVDMADAEHDTFALRLPNNKEVRNVIKPRQIR